MGKPQLETARTGIRSIDDLGLASLSRGSGQRLEDHKAMIHFKGHPESAQPGHPAAQQRSGLHLDRIDPPRSGLEGFNAQSRGP